MVGDYRCKCQAGWTGKNCDQNINDCVGQCQHGATCIDLVNDYHCACQPGYTGQYQKSKPPKNLPIKKIDLILDHYFMNWRQFLFKSELH